MAQVQYKRTWGNVVSKNAKAVVATLTPAVALGTSLALTLPANIAAPITAGVSVVTGFITWLTANTEELVEVADSVEGLGESALGRDI
ncbi:membrane protein [Gordonia phage Genamy16]|uniref:Membrane protein n=2 Tax=Lambovirus TaxID=2843412 RepID=A0A9E7Q4X8_9CAUD|nr:membrane protein [Gordonia phage Genamy16]UVF61744.1 membrane protein [Gordonia phage NovaSharks]UVK63121.1 membrane protein [Gordonia phage Rumi]WNM65342.1 membrane protein [Gordonia phage Alyssamiracle]